MTRSKKVLIIGLGRFGNAVADTLWSRGADVAVVDRDSALVDAIKGRAHGAFVADGTDQSVLESVGARHVDAAVVTFGESFESAVLAVSTLKALGVREIIARASTTRRADVLRAVGATRVLEVEQEMGVRVAQELLTPSAGDLLELASQYRVVPWLATGSLVGQSLKDSGLRQRYGVNVIGVRPAGEKGNRLKPPSPDYVLKAGDICLLVAEDAEIQRFMEKVGH
jgi:trk system potassium uptake protein